MYNLSKRLGRPAIAGVAVIALMGTVPAIAADAVYEEPPVPSAPAETLPISTWSGIYGGLTLGYGFGETSVPGNVIDTDGFLGGVFAGAQFQSGSFVYGGEADVGYNWMDGANAGQSTEAGVEGTLRARLGYAPTDRLLVYGTGGVAAGEIGLTNPAGSDSNTVVGWTAGAGIDAKITDKIFGRLEYRYVDYGNETFTTGAVTQSVDVNQNKVLLGVGVQF